MTDGAPPREGGLSWAARLFLVNTLLLVGCHLGVFELLEYADSITPRDAAPGLLAAYLGALGFGVGTLGAFIAGTIYDDRRPGLVVLGAYALTFLVPGLVAAALTATLGMGAVVLLMGPVVLLPVVEAALIWGRRGPGAWLLIALHLVGLALLFVVGTEVDFNQMTGGSVRMVYVVIDVALCLLWSIAPLLRPPPPADAFWY